MRVLWRRTDKRDVWVTKTMLERDWLSMPVIPALRRLNKWIKHAKPV